MPLHLHLVRSPAELTPWLGAWDRLWQRSDVVIPTVQADHLQLWLRTFAPQQRFQATLVADGEQLVAALPLVEQRLRGILAVGYLPSNDWTPSGELLLDPACDVPAALDVLVGGLRRLPWPLLWLDAALYETPRWQALLGACARAGLGVAAHERFRISQIAIESPWPSYRQTWSGNHRRNMTRHMRRLCRDHGEVTLRVCRPTAAVEITALLRCGFEIEDRSWKGAARTSVLRTPGRFEFFLRQGSLLAGRGELELYFLDVAGEPQAFLYAWKSKGVVHPFKCGFNESLRDYGVGQLLMHEVLRHCFSQPDEYRLLDCMGPVSPMTQKWETGQYAVGRVAIAPKKLLGQVALALYQHVWPSLRRWRGGGVGAAVPERAAWSPGVTPVE